MFDIKKYIFTFAITVAIFATAFLASNFFSSKRVEDVKQIQDNIAIDILSSETQFDILKDVSCSNVNDTFLSPELSELSDKLSHTENDRGPTDPDVLYLKKYYSLLEIKDYLLSKNIATKCPSKKTTSIIYFYSNKGDCPDCTKEGYVLTFLREKYPDLRVYSFDYNLPLSAIDSLKSIYKIQDELPAIVINDTLYTGYKTLEEVEALLPTKLKMSTTTQATSTASLRKVKR